MLLEMTKPPRIDWDRMMRRHAVASALFICTALCAISTIFAVSYYTTVGESGPGYTDVDQQREANEQADRELIALIERNAPYGQVPR